MATLFQAGLLTAFLQGVYEGNITYKHITEFSDTGLGTFNFLDGEMIAVDGIFYRINEYGVAEKVSEATGTPFAVVTKFKPESSLSLKKIPSLAELEQQLADNCFTANIFYMFKIEANLDCITFRSAGCCKEVGRPLTEVLPRIEKVYELTNIKGTLVSTYCPSYSREITIAGFHHHFIDSKRRTGGHVYDLKLSSGVLQVMPIYEFKMMLNSNDLFLHAKLEQSAASLAEFMTQEKMSKK